MTKRKPNDSTLDQCPPCPFSLLCLMGRVVHENGNPAQHWYICPKCECLWREGDIDHKVHCPKRKMKGRWKGAWNHQYNKAVDAQPSPGLFISHEAKATVVMVYDPAAPGSRIPIYLCDRCYQFPPTPKREVSLYEILAEEEGIPMP